MPDWKNLVHQRLAPLGLTPVAEADLVEELSRHLEDRYRELCSGGAEEQEVLENVLSELQDLDLLRANLRSNQRMPKRDAVPAGDVRPGNLLDDLSRDVRYAFRAMRQSPLFVVFVVLTLALGIGANTTVFTVINTLILNPLPVRQTSDLTSLEATDAGANAKSNAAFPISYADLKEYQTRNQVFISLAGYTSPRGLTWRNGGVAQGMFGELVTDDYFSTLGLVPAQGRFFSAEENRTPGTHAVAVMSYGAWQSRFGGAADIVGKELLINNVALTLIGVGPPKFIGLNAIFGPDLWIPAAMAERLLPGGMRNALSDRAKAVFRGVGRLKPGATRMQAQANMTTLAFSLAREYPETDEGHTIAVHPIRDALFGSSSGSAARMYFASAALLIVVGIVLLIACSNVANLLLARSASRQKEMAVRLAIGASRARLIRQLLTESVLLGFLSGALGLLAAYAALQLLFGMLPGTANFPKPNLDASVFAFNLAISLATGFLFGSIPGFRAARANVADTLKAEARTSGRSRARVTLANALLVGQVAFSFLLLVTAALFLRSIGRAYELDPGFQTAHLVVMTTNPGQGGYTRAQSKAFYKDVRQRVTGLPGVASMSWASNMPLWADPLSGLQVEGGAQRSRTDTLRTIVNTVDLGYFHTAGVAIAQGREFTNMDREDSVPVAIVNEKMAHDYWPDGALGKRIQVPGEQQLRQIVGVAKTANYTNWGEAPQLCVYEPLEQRFSDAMVLYARSTADPREIARAVEREVHAAAPQIFAPLIFNLRTGKQIIDGGLFQARMGVALLSIFGVLALGLASIGLYGVLAYSVNQRSREIGLRMALGATNASVLKLVLAEGMSLVSAGVLIGFVGALFAGRLLSRMLYGVSPSDPASVTGAAFVLTAIALVACFLPAYRATRVDPLAALREG